MREKLVILAAGIAVGAAAATFVYVAVSDGSKTSLKTESSSNAASQRLSSPDESDEAAQSASTKATEPAPAGYKKGGEVPKEIDVDKVRRNDDVLDPGESHRGRVQAPEKAGEDFAYYTNFHPLRARSGQTLRILVEPNDPEGLRPLVMLWATGEDGAPDHQLELTHANRGAASLEYDFAEDGTYIISVDDARNLPPDGSKPDRYVGGPRFSYRIELRAVGAATDAR